MADEGKAATGETEGEEETLRLAKVAFATAARHGMDGGPSIGLTRVEHPQPHHASLKEALRQPDVEGE